MPTIAGDASVVRRWTQAFITETDPAAQPPPATGADPDGPRTAPAAALADAVGRIATGCLWLWEDGGEPVSMVYASPAHGGVSRISLVYTPSRLRRRGYASACVAAASAIQTDLGHRCMLFTDLANPTSNDIYQAVGYRRCGDAVQVCFG